MWITNKGLDIFRVWPDGKGVNWGRWNRRIEESKVSGRGRWIKLVIRLPMTNLKYTNSTFYYHSLWNPQ